MCTKTLSFISCDFILTNMLLLISLTVAQNEDVVEQFLKENVTAGMIFMLHIQFLFSWKIVWNVNYFYCPCLVLFVIDFSNAISRFTVLVSCQMLCASLVENPHSWMHDPSILKPFNPLSPNPLLLMEKSSGWIRNCRRLQDPQFN